MLRKALVLIVIAVVFFLTDAGRPVAADVPDLSDLDISPISPDFTGLLTSLTLLDHAHYPPEGQAAWFDLQNSVPDLSDVLSGAAGLLPPLRNALESTGEDITAAGSFLTTTAGPFARNIGTILVDAASDPDQDAGDSDFLQDLALQGAGAALGGVGSLLENEVGPPVTLVGESLGALADVLPDLAALQQGLADSLAGVDDRLPPGDAGSVDLEGELSVTIQSLEAIGLKLSDLISELPVAQVDLSDPDDEDSLAGDAETPQPEVAVSEADSEAIGLDGTTVADTLDNTGSLSSDAFALDIAFEDETLAIAAGIQARAGNDTVVNTGEIAAGAVAAGGNLTGGISGLKLNIGIPGISAQAVGVDGGHGNDNLENEGSIAATATAVIVSHEITANVGLSTTDDPMRAAATAVGMDGGAGADTLFNSGTLSAAAISYTGAGGTAVSGGINAVAPNFTTTTAHLAESTATGAVGGAGNDRLENSGQITATATALAGERSADLQTLGAAKVVSTSEAVSTATALDAGDDGDTVTNADGGTLNAVAVSVAVSQSGKVSHDGRGSFNPYTWGGGAAAESKADGVVLGSGNDTLTNDGAISAVATAVTGSGAASISPKGAAKVDATSKADAAAMGVSGGDGADSITNNSTISAVSTATAATVEVALSGEGSTGTAGVLQKLIHKGGAYADAEAVGIESDGLWRTTEFDHDASLSAGALIWAGQVADTAAAGDDMLVNSGVVSAVATGVSGSGAAAVTLKNAARSDTNSDAWARAVALDTGAGNDAVTNAGALAAVSTAAAGAMTVNISGAKSGSARSNTAAAAEAIGISGDGTSADSRLFESFSVGDSQFSAITLLEHKAAAGADTIINSGDISAVATAVSGSSATGISSATGDVGKISNDTNATTAKSTAEAAAVGIDAGAGNDSLDNSSVISAVATATAGSLALSVSQSADASTTKDMIKQLVFSGGAQAAADAVGARGDSVYASTEAGAKLNIGKDKLSETIYYHRIASGGSDTITNDGDIAAAATAVTASESVSLAVDGAAKADAVSSAEASAMGIDAGGGDDSLANSGTVSAVATAVAVGLDAGFTNATADSTRSAFIRSFVDYGTTAQSRATGISGDSGFSSHLFDETALVTDEKLEMSAGAEKAVSSGLDTIDNSGAVTAVSTAVSGAGSGALSIKKAASAHTSSSASADATGIDAGAGHDTVTNSGTLTVVSSAVANSLSLAYSDADDGAVTANATAEAAATGINGAGALRGASLSSGLILTNDALNADAVFSTSTAGGNDTITNSGAVTAAATAEAGAFAVSGSSSDKSTGFLHNANIAEANATARATATGIDAGAGQDSVENSGTIASVSTATAGALEVALSAAKDSSTTKNWLKQSILDGGVSAAATAYGIRGDGIGSGSETGSTLHIDADNISADAYHHAHTASGDDTIMNNGAVTAVATAVSGAASGSISASGAVKADAVSEAAALAVGVEAGAGSDTVANHGAITAVATAEAAGLEVSYSTEKGADATRSWLTKGFLDYGASAESEAVGVKGDGDAADYFADTSLDVTVESLDAGASLEKAASSGADSITNQAAITAVATAATQAASVAASAKGAATAGGAASAASTATGIDAGAGNDTVANNGALTAVSTATGLAFGMTVTESKNSIASATAEAEATAVGISGDGRYAEMLAASDLRLIRQSMDASTRFQVTSATGDDTIDNTGAVTTVATAVSGADALGLSTSDSVTANTSSSATAEAMGIDAGAGADTVNNSGNLTTVANAEAGAIGIALGNSSAFNLYAYFLGGSEALTTATGIAGDGHGSDFSTTGTLDIQWTEEGSGTTGMERHLAVSSETFYGMAGDADTITNSGNLSATAVSVAPAVDAVISFDGQGLALTNAKAESTAAGIDAGTGDDTVTNSGNVTATAVSTAEAVTVSVAKNLSVSGHTLWDGGVRSSAEAVGISGDGKGRDHSAVMEVSLDAVGIIPGEMTDQFSAGMDTCLTSTVVSGADVITNEGSVTATAVAAAPAAGVAASYNGSGAALATAEADARAVGIDAGSGSDTVTNQAQGSVVATAVATAEAVNVAAAKNSAYAGGLLFDGTVASTAEAVGISGDGQGRDYTAAGHLGLSGQDGLEVGSSLAATTVTGADTIDNAGDVIATAVAASPAVSVAVGVEGAAAALTASTADAAAMGIDAGAGHDTVVNSGNVTATAVATAEAVNVAVAKNAALAADSLWEGGITATADAVGISGDGNGRDLTASGSVELEDGKVLARTRLAATAAAGNDTIKNSGPVTATAVAATPQAGVSVSVDGVAAALATAEADARAVGIDAGAGDDAVSIRGPVTATAAATAAALNISVSSSAAEAGTTLYDGSAKAAAEAIGISGDGAGQDYTATGSVSVTETKVLVQGGLAATAAKGNDFIHNHDAVVATSAAVAPAVDVAVAASGFAVTDTGAQAESRAAGIDAGAGDDTVLNATGGAIVSTAAAMADAVSVNVTPSGFALGVGGIFDGGASATADAVGISGDGTGQDNGLTGSVSVNEKKTKLAAEAFAKAAAGEDAIVNQGAIVSTAVSESLSVDVAVAAEGVAAAVTKASADARATGVDAGAGGDAVDNSGAIVSSAVAAAESVTVSVAGTGNADALDGVLSAGTSACAAAVGVAGDSRGRDTTVTGDITVTQTGDTTLSAGVEHSSAGGDDTLTNDGSVTATSVAGALSTGVAVTVTAGVALAAAGAEAGATATAMDGGQGGDTITNRGVLTATAVANADALGVAYTSIGLSGELSGVLDGGASAGARAVGISADGYAGDASLSSTLSVKDKTMIDAGASFSAVSGNDSVNNDNSVTATAVSAVPAVSVSVAAEGVALAATRAESEARADAVDLGAGDDVLTSTGTLTATAVANADAVAVSVTPGGVAGATDAFWDGGTTAVSDAAGIGGDGHGLDTALANTITVDADTTTITSGYARTAAAGNDTIANAGAVTATSVATTATADIAVAVAGVAGAVATAEADATAAAIDAGAGDDQIINTGTLTSTSVGGAMAISGSVTLGGVAGAANNFLDGGTTARAQATGISADGRQNNLTIDNTVTIDAAQATNQSSMALTGASGNDRVENHGQITTTAVAEALSSSAGVAIAGVAAGTCTSRAEAGAASIETGGGDDAVINSGQLVSTAVASAYSQNTTVTGIGVAIGGDALVTNGTTASAEAVGIRTDAEDGDVTVDDTVTVKDGEVTIQADLAATAGAGSDTVTNSGNVAATAVALAPTSDMSVAMLGVSAALAHSTAEARAAAIDTGGGDDQIANSGDLSATAVANADGLAVSFSLAGVDASLNNILDGGITAQADAVGITADGLHADHAITSSISTSGGAVAASMTEATRAAAGADFITNSGDIQVTAAAVAPSISKSIGGAGISAGATTASAGAAATAIDGGDGADIIVNNGNLSAVAVANADAVSIPTTLAGISGNIDSVLTGGTTATAAAVGISGDSQAAGDSRETNLSAANDIASIHTLYEKAAAGGNDSITNDGTVEAVAVTAAPSWTDSISLLGVSAALTRATAGADAVAIDAGAGDDTITNRGALTATAVANADAVSLSLGLAGAVGSANAFWEGGTVATAEAVGISADGFSFHTSEDTAAVACGGNIWIDDLFSTQTRGGNDTIDNQADIDATAVVVAPTVSSAINGIGVSAAVSTATADADAAALAAGGGDDTVTNSGDLTAAAVANADAIAFAGTLVGVSGAATSVWNGGTTAEADAVGIGGDSGDENRQRTYDIDITSDSIAISEQTTLTHTGGDDTITNHGAVDVAATAVTITADASLEGLGLAAAASTSTAAADAAAIDAGLGADTVTNNGDLIAASNAVAVGVSVAAGAAGLTVASDAVWDGGTTAEAEAVGIRGDSDAQTVTTTQSMVVGNTGSEPQKTVVETLAGGDDVITSTRSIQARADAASTAVGVSGVLLGVSTALADGTAIALSSGIAGGGGDDTVLNQAAITSVSNASATTVAVAPGALGLAVATDATWDGGTSADADAFGISGGEGDDRLTNTAEIIASSSADNAATAVAVTLAGASFASSAAAADAEAVALAGGAGNDTITNSAALYVLSDAAGAGAGVSVTAAGYGQADASMDIGTAACGISGGEGDDDVGNSALISTVADAAATAGDVGVVLAGAADADTTTFDLDGGVTAIAEALGISGGSGQDTLANSAYLYQAASADASAGSVSIGLLGYSAADTSTSAAATAVSMDGGAGNDTLTNTGYLETSADVDADAASVSVALAGAGSAAAAISAAAAATGISGAGDNDLLANTGVMDITATAATSQNGVSVALAGGSGATGGISAAADAAGMSGGTGDDTLVNSGSITVAAGGATTQSNSAVTLAGSSAADGTVTAKAGSRGIAGGAGADYLWNDGNINTTSSAVLSGNTAAVTIAGAAGAGDGLNAHSNAYGVDMGAGDDYVVSAGTVTADAGAEISQHGDAVGIFGAGNLTGGSLEADAVSVGLAMGDGDDTLTHEGDITVAADAALSLADSATAVIGASNQRIVSGAKAYAAGLAGGDGRDFLEGAAQIDVDATAAVNQQASGFSFAGAAGAGSSLLADARGAGIDAGGGADVVDSSAIIDVDAGASTTLSSGATAVFGASATDGASGAIAAVKGIDGGDDDADDVIQSTGSIDATATADVLQDGAGFTFGGAGGDTGALTADTDAAGIAGGGGNDSLFNQGHIAGRAEAMMTISGSATTIFGAATTGGVTGALARAAGMDGGSGDDLVHNTADVTVDALAAVSQTGGAFTLGGAGGGGGALSAEAAATGLGAGNGADILFNSGNLQVGADAGMTVSGSTTTIFGAAGSTARSGARAHACGMDAGSGNDMMENRQTLAVNGSAHIQQSADANTFAGGSNGSAALSAVTSATGMEGGGGDDLMTNLSVLDVTGSAALDNQTALNVAFGVSSSGAVGDQTADVTAISGGAGADTIENHGTIGVAGEALADFSTSVITSAAGGATVSLGSSQDTLSAGILGGAGNDNIGHYGDMLVTSDASAIAGSYAYATAGLATAHIAMDASTEAFGFSGGAGDDVIYTEGQISIISRAAVDLDTTAVAAVAGDARGISTAGADAYAAGVSGGEGHDTIANAGSITVCAEADAIAVARADGFLTLHTAAADATASATAHGIVDLSGNNTVINDGTITATVDAAVTSTLAWNLASGPGTSATDVNAVGVLTGAGDDVIVNRGTISAATVALANDGTVTNGLGTAIDAGAGDDTVTLCQGSSITGLITGGAGTDALVLDGAGDLGPSGIAIEFETAVKQGPGTFSMPVLPNDIRTLEITGGTLDVLLYGMDSGDTFSTYVDGNGDFGQLAMGIGSVDGALVVNRGAHAFTGDTTFDIVTASSMLGGAFDTTTLPETTPLVSFSLTQDLRTIRVAADVNEFSSLVHGTDTPQARVAQYLDTILPTATGDLSHVLGSIQAISDPSGITAAYADLSPGSYENATRSMLSTMNLHVGTVQDRLALLRADAGPRRSSGAPLFLGSGYAGLSVTEDGFGPSGTGRKTGSVWAVQLNNSGYRRGDDTGRADVEQDTTGLVIGVDYRPDERTFLGAGFSNTYADLSYADGLKDGLVSSYLCSTYGSHFFSDHAYVASVLTYGQLESESLRAIVLDSDIRQARSLHSGEILSAVVETGRAFEAGDLNTEVFGLLEYTSLREEGFREDGAGGVNLVVEPGRSDYLTSVIGLRLGRYFQDPDQENLFMVQINAGWLHDFDIDSDGITARFEGVPQSFSIDRNPREIDGLRLGGAVTFMSRDRLDLSARVNADLYPDKTGVSGLLQLNLNF